MPAYNKRQARPAARTFLTGDRYPTGKTREGAPGYARDARTELFIRATTIFAGQDSFYEDAIVRDDRLRALVRELAVTDFEWLAGFLPWLRTDGRMRTAPVLLAAEAVHERLSKGLAGGNRQLVNSVLKRADEPGELWAYWVSRWGRKVPVSVKRGLADAIIWLWDEFALLKYDTASHGVRFGDLIDLVHPVPPLSWQSDLYKYALDRRHHRDNPVPPSLRKIIANQDLRTAVAEGGHEYLLSPSTLRVAGMTWEDALSLAGEVRLDKRAVWEAMIPSMGYMALLRNLRNFDDAGVSDDVAEQVTARLADPQQVAKAMQLPYRYLSALREVKTFRWGHALDKALTLSLGNVPAMKGQTLILVDVSTSMSWPLSGKSQMQRWDTAVTFALGLAQTADNPQVVAFSTSSREFPRVKGESLLHALERFKSGGYFIGGGTETARALRQHYQGHDRVVIITDEQASRDYDYREVTSGIPANIPMYVWNVAGYTYGVVPDGPNRHLLAGITDSSFKVISMIEAGESAAWPWESASLAA